MRAPHFVYPLALMALLPTPAYAYLDPGAGSMLLQGILAAVAAGAAGISIYWQRVKGFFSRRSSTQSDSPDR